MQHRFESEYAALTREDATRLFGASDFATAVFSQAAGDWSEPVRSGFGWHLVKVTAVEPARLLPFEEVLPDVRAASLNEADGQRPTPATRRAARAVSRRFARREVVIPSTAHTGRVARSGRSRPRHTTCAPPTWKSPNNPRAYPSSGSSRPRHRV